MASMRRLSILILTTALFVALLGLGSGVGIHTAYAADNHSHSATQFSAKYTNLPASFVANVGQTDPSVRFQVRTGHSTLFFGTDSVSMALSSPNLRSQSALPFDSSASAQVVIRLNFVGANPNALLDGLGQLPSFANFFVGSDPSHWHANVPTYVGVIYHSLYPGVDLTYTNGVGALKGTYTLSTGVDPSVIHWRYAGASDLRVDPTNGDLLIDAANGVGLTEKMPVAWQTRDGQRVPVAIGYQVRLDGTVGFALAASNYDRSLPLTIDPSLDYATYLGGNSDDLGYGIAVDSSGNVYVTGYTLSTTFPTTSGALQTVFGGGNTYGDVFISKLNATGTALIYSTYLGGSGNDKGRSLALDANGNVYVTGQTDGGFPIIPGAAQATFGGGICPGNVPCYDAFVTELNATGNTLLYSTYLGGMGDDIAYQVALDRSENVYVVGQTTGSFPTTLNAYQTTYSGNYDAFVSKLNPSVSGTASLVYSTYLGGPNLDIGRAIAVDQAGNAYVAGYTTGGYPTTPGAYQQTFGGVYDAFVTKLNSNGTAPIYSSYIGGTGNDNAYGIAVDANNNAYVVGNTDGAFPVTVGAYQTSYGGGPSDTFISKMNAAGTNLVYSTYLGGNGQDGIFNGISVDASGDVFLTGATTSTNFPVTSNAAQPSFSGGGTYGDGFVTKLSASGTNLIYSTYLGGSNEDSGHGIATDGNSNAYITGWTNSGNFPITPGALQNIYGGGNYDAFVSELTMTTGRIDTIGIFRSGTFYLRLHNSTGFADRTVAFNPASQPYPLVGDWTGAGIDTVGVFNQSNGLFSLCTSNSTANCANSANVINFVLGNPADQPMGGRWQASATHFGGGIFRPSNGLIYLKNNLTTGFADYTMVLGIPGDVGLAGDWDGDGLDSPGVYRPSATTFYLSNSVCNCAVFGDFQILYGNPGDTPVMGDWTGQGHDGVGLFRQSNGFTYLKNQLVTGYADIPFVFGIAGDVPIAGHWQLTYPPKPNPGSVLVPPTSLPGGTGAPPSGLGD
ncbi:MAG: SBBP repeat-containing protein [Aggregatilineales bacterium]